MCKYDPEKDTKGRGYYYAFDGMPDLKQMFSKSTTSQSSNNENHYEYDPSDYDYDPIEADMAEDGWCDKAEYLDAMDYD